MGNKRVLFRVDASSLVGYGHLMRCLSLANALKERGHTVAFLSHFSDKAKYSELREKGYDVYPIKEMEDDWQHDLEDTVAVINSLEKFHWVVVDHYQLDHKWESQLFKQDVKILVIDDLATSTHQCHYLINPTYSQGREDYSARVNSDATLLLGGRFALLRSEFNTLRKKVNLFVNPSKMKGHVFFGSADPLDYCLQYSELLLSHFSDLSLKVINPVAKGPSWSTLKEKYSDRIDIIHKVSNMATTMLDCDFAFGAPGTTTWERATLGLAGVYVATHPNQVKILQRLSDLKFCHFLGVAGLISKHHFIHAVSDILGNVGSLQTMGRLGYEHIDGLGTQRVSAVIEGSGI